MNIKIVLIRLTIISKCNIEKETLPNGDLTIILREYGFCDFINFINNHINWTEILDGTELMHLLLIPYI
jgi:hypothetical protein